MFSKFIFVVVFFAPLFLSASPRVCVDVFKALREKRINLQFENQFVKAVQLLEAGQRKQALEFSLLYFRLNPLHHRNLFLLGDIYRTLKDYEKSIFFYEKAMQLNPYPRWELNRLIELTQVTGDFKSRYEYIKKILEIEGEDSRLLVILVRTLVEMGEFEKARLAVARMRKLEEANPEEVLSASVRVLAGQGKYDTAIRVIDIFLTKPGNENNLYVLGLKASFAKKQGDLLTAIEVHRQILKLNKKNKVSLTQLGHLLMLVGKYPEAIHFLERALVLEPNNHLIHWNLIQSLNALGRVEALKSIEKGNAPEKIKLLAKAVRLILEEQYTEGIRVLDQLEAGVVILQMKAQAYYLSGRMDQSYLALTQILKKSSKTNYQAIAALIKIEMQDKPLGQFKYSPLLEATMRTLSDVEVEAVLKTLSGNVWAFESLDLESTDTSAIQNSFWSQSGLYSRPVNGQAVKELR